MSAYLTVTDALRANAFNVVERGDGKASAQCPGHDDRSPSLSIGPRRDGKGVVVFCHAGCALGDLLAKVGLSQQDLFDEPRLRDAYSQSRTYTYSDGRKVHRGAGKTFHQSGNTQGTALYGVEHITPDADPVYAVEGEKDALAVLAVGGVAVTAAMGAGKAAKFDWTPLAGHHVVIVVDRDKSGHKHAREVEEILDGIAAKVELKQAKIGKDLADHIAAGYGLDELVPLEPEPPEPQDQPAAANAAAFFDRDGLRVQDLARAVMSRVSCGFNDTDESFYTYRAGVWLPNRGDIEAQICALLGNRYRGSHATNTKDVIRYSPDTARITRDCQPTYINLANGMYDWRRGKLLAHDPAYLSTIQLPIKYNPDASCPLFDRFISGVLPEDCWKANKNNPGFIWELIAYTLYSGNPLHVAILLYGNGRNGKGTFIRLLEQLLGARNCSTVTLHELSENRFRAATLYGKLANLAGDIDSRWLESTAMFKAITGGDTIQGENKYGPAFDFRPWALPVY